MSRILRPAGRGGFSLPETFIALTISSVLILLVGGVFLVQNDFYSHVLLRSQVQENARALSEVVATEVRSVAPGAVILADSTRLVIRSPMVTALICGDQGSDVIAHVRGGISSITTSEVAGFGHRDPLTGTWNHYDLTWAQMEGSGGNPPNRCKNKGADISGASSEFIRLERIDNETGIDEDDLLGHVIMIFRETEFRFDPSLLVSGDRALYRGIYGQTLVEFATGVATDARFEFRTGGPTWAKYVAPASLSAIDGIRLVAQSVGKGESSQQLTYDFGWTVDIPLANTY